MKILVVNAGSSSVKYQLINMDDGSVMAKGLCERIGGTGGVGHITHTPLATGKEKYSSDKDFPTHAEAIAAVLEILTDKEYGVVKEISEIDAVGHRVLHGGMEFTESCIIDDAVIAAIERCIPLGPLHNPANLLGIKACQAVMPGVPQVAVFDTAFHMTMPPKAYRYAIEKKYYEEDHVRRYGFHGTSHRYIAQKAAEITGGVHRLINCHLGNGSSLCAIVDGKCVDTTMGLSPLAGVPMGTRSGDLDPCVVEYLCNTHGYTVSEMLTILNKKSGVLALSGKSSDFRDLEAGANAGDEKCALALEKFAYECRKYVGAYAAAMGGVDMITFTAGVGENSDTMRARICDGLQYMGVEIDEEANHQRGDVVDITGKNSKVKVMVIATNEELMIAKDTEALVLAAK